MREGEWLAVDLWRSPSEGMTAEIVRRSSTTRGGPETAETARYTPYDPIQKPIQNQFTRKNDKGAKIPQEGPDGRSRARRRCHHPCSAAAAACRRPPRAARARARTARAPRRGARPGTARDGALQREWVVMGRDGSSRVIMGHVGANTCIGSVCCQHMVPTAWASEWVGMCTWRCHHRL